MLGQATKVPPELTPPGGYPQRRLSLRQKGMSPGARCHSKGLATPWPHHWAVGGRPIPGPHTVTRRYHQVKTTGQQHTLVLYLFKPIPHPGYNWGSCIELSGRINQNQAVAAPVGPAGCQPGRGDSEESASPLLCHPMLSSGWCLSI